MSDPQNQRASTALKLRQKLNATSSIVASERCSGKCRKQKNDCPRVEFDPSDVYFFVLFIQAQLQRSLDSSVSTQPRALIGRRGRKEAMAAALGAGTDSDGHGGSPVSEQDSGILDVEDEEDDDVRKLQTYTQMHEITGAALEPLISNFT